MFRILFFLALVAVSSPALAGDSIALPEAPNMMLFALGVLGVIVGRKAAMRRPDDDGK